MQRESHKITGEVTQAGLRNATTAPQNLPLFEASPSQTYCQELYADIQRLQNSGSQGDRYGPRYPRCANLTGPRRRI